MTEIINGSGGNGAGVQTPAVGVVRSGESVATLPRVESGKIVDIAKYREEHPRVDVQQRNKEDAGKILSFAKKEGIKSTWAELAKNNVFKTENASEKERETGSIGIENNAPAKASENKPKVFEGELIIGKKQSDTELESQDDTVQDKNIDTMAEYYAVTLDPKYQDKVEDKIREAEENGEEVDIEQIKQEALKEYQAEKNKILEKKPEEFEEEKLPVAERVAVLEQQIAVQQEQISKLTESLEKTQERIQKLAEMNAELAALMLELMAEEDEEKKEDIAAKILKLMTNLVGIFMQSLVDPDKAQAEAAEKIKESGPDEVDEPSKNDPEIAERIRQYQELMKERQQAERVPQEV